MKIIVKLELKERWNQLILEYSDISNTLNDKELDLLIKNLIFSSLTKLADISIEKFNNDNANEKINLKKHV